jgi:AraC-like DNA-binding protein
MRSKEQQPQFLFPAGTQFSADNLVLWATAKRHIVTDFAGPLSIKTVQFSEVDWIVSGRRLRVDPASFLVLNEGQKYSMEIDSIVPVTTCCIFFRRGFVEEIALDATTPIHQSLDSKPRVAPALDFLSRLHSDRKRQFLERMWSLARRCSQELQPSSFEEEFLIISEHLLLLNAQTRARMARVPAAKASTRNELYRRLEIAREYMHGNLHERISLDDIAREACVSRYHLHRTFKQVFHCTPHGYLTTIRLERAKALLQAGHSALDTALALGFESPSAFSRLFRAHYGQPPSALRKISKIGQARA